MPKLKQVGTIRVNGKAYGPKQARELAGMIDKKDLERLQKNPRVFTKLDTIEDDDTPVSIAEENDIDSIMDANQLRTLRRQAKTPEDKERIDARIAQLSA